MKKKKEQGEGREEAVKGPFPVQGTTTPISSQGREGRVELHKKTSTKFKNLRSD